MAIREFIRANMEKGFFCDVCDERWDSYGYLLLSHECVNESV